MESVLVCTSINVCSIFSCSCQLIMARWLFLVGLALIGRFQKACLFFNQLSNQSNQCSPRACLSTCWAPPRCRQHLLLEPSAKILRDAIFFFSCNQFRCPIWLAAYLDSAFARAVWVRARGARLSPARRQNNARHLSALPKVTLRVIAVSSGCVWRPWDLCTHA